MRILMINSVCGIKSTGRICTDLADELERHGHTVRIAYGRGNLPQQYSRYAVRIGNALSVKIHGCYARVFDAAGFGSYIVTKSFIKWVQEYDPDVIHIHNIHGYYLNIPVLFDYIRQSNKRIIWTLHDCWPFTGHCCYFDDIGCNKWKVQCSKCQQKQEYPASLVLDRSGSNYLKKKKMFSEIPNMILVTPSRWLASLVQQSFLNQYPVYRIPNWVNTNTFKHTTGTFKKEYGIEKEYIVLGVASVWDRRKGMETFIRLDEVLGDEYQIVLVGLQESQLNILPKSIIGLSHTNSEKELAEIYSAADVFVNPTLEDNYPSTNLESIACGTPVITYDVGGSGESANLYGKAVPKGNFVQLAEAIQQVIKNPAGLISPDIEKRNELSFNQYLQLIEGRPVDNL